MVLDLLPFIFGAISFTAELSAGTSCSFVVLIFSSCGDEVLFLSWFVIADIFLPSGPFDMFDFDTGSVFRVLTEETWWLLLILGSDNLLIRVMDAFVSDTALPFTFFGSSNDDTDRLNLFPAEVLLVLNFLVLEPLRESADPAERVLIGNLCRGDTDPGSESLNLDPL